MDISPTPASYPERNKIRLILRQLAAETQVLYGKF